MLDAALANLALRGRVVLCGAISQYNRAETQGPRNYIALVSRRGRMEGFVVLDYADRAFEAFAEMLPWVQEGKLRLRLDVVEGLEHASSALGKLFVGENDGKLLIKIAS
jgi:NADPH-dependent curcumin reductase CurA